MDGKGSIQVNHSREQFLQYRLIIKLSELAPIQKVYPCVRGCAPSPCVNSPCVNSPSVKVKVKDQQAKAHPNYKMLVQIAKVIGGTVRIVGKGGDVI